jgi:hypothetical protein
MKEGGSTFKFLTGKPTGKRPLGRPKRGCEDNIRMDLKEIGIIGELGLFGPGRGLFESPCKCGLEPPGPINNGFRKLDYHPGLFIELYM